MAPGEIILNSSIDQVIEAQQTETRARPAPVQVSSTLKVKKMRSGQVGHQSMALIGSSQRSTLGLSSDHALSIVVLSPKPQRSLALDEKRVQGTQAHNT